MGGGASEGDIEKRVVSVQLDTLFIAFVNVMYCVEGDSSKSGPFLRMINDLTEGIELDQDDILRIKQEMNENMMRNMQARKKYREKVLARKSSCYGKRGLNTTLYGWR